MPRSLSCPACSARLTLPDRLPDNVKTLRCPKCRVSINVVKKPAAGSTPQPPVREMPPVEPPPTPAAYPSTQGGGVLPDIDDIRLAGDEPVPPPPRPASPAPPPPAVQREEPEESEALDDETVAPESREESDAIGNLELPEREDLVELQASTDEDDLVDLEASPDEDELVELQASEDGDDAAEPELIEDEPEEAEVVEDEKPEPLPGLLQFDEFLLKPKGSLLNLTYNIQDYETRDVVGRVGEELGALRLLAPGLIRKAASLTMHDDIRDRVLCTLYRPFSLLKSRVEIRNRKGRMLGTIRFRFLNELGGTIYDEDDREWGTIRGGWGSAYHIKNKAGKSMGKFMLEMWKTRKATVVFNSSGMPWYVKIGRRLRYDHDGKLLFLATVVAHDMARIANQAPR